MNPGQIIRQYAEQAEEIATSTGPHAYQRAADILFKIAAQLERRALLAARRQAKRRGRPVDELPDDPRLTVKRRRGETWKATGNPDQRLTLTRKK